MTIFKSFPIRIKSTEPYYLKEVSMENPNNTITYISEGILTEILARLPLRSISRFKLVCKTWKSILESLSFRRLFVSLHQNKSRSWSLVCGVRRFAIDFHRCQTWGLPEFVGYYFRNIFKGNGKIGYKDSSNGLVLIKEYKCAFYVGNPILKLWVVIPIPTPSYSMARLVTRVDEEGVVLSFKVVTFDIKAMTRSEDRSSSGLNICVYSSETGVWTPKQIHFPHYFLYPERPMTLHRMLYIYSLCVGSNVIVAHDFYGESNVSRVIPLPDPDTNNDRSLTTSTEFVIYMKTLADNVLKVWRLLNSDDSVWELLWETRLQFIPSDDNLISYDLLGMHPFDRSIVYLWSLKNRHLVSCNLKTQSYHIFIGQDGDLQNCFVNHSVCEKDVDGLCALYLHPRIRYCSFQYVFPRWMGSIPCPPRSEILDTTSVFSHKFSEEKKELKQVGFSRCSCFSFLKK